VQAFQALEFDPEFAGPQSWALMYRAKGLQIMPGMTPAEDPQNWKRPFAAWKEFENAQVPDATFDRWYGNEGQHRTRVNMGVICGAASSGLIVLDLDQRDGKDGLAWFCGLLAVHANNMWPETPCQRTGGGGRQLFFYWPANGTQPPTFKTSIGVDLRGQGGYAVVPPSRHESGLDYAWEDGREPWAVPIMVMPDWLVEAVGKLRELFAKNAGQPAAERTPSDEDFNKYGLAVDGREERMRDIVWGVACDLRREFAGPVDPDRAGAERERAWSLYTQEVRSRLVQPGASNEDLLEREGRGRTAFIEKWDYALGQWDGKLAEAAAQPKSNPLPKAEPAGDWDAWAHPAVPPFPLDCLPETTRDFVEHQHISIGADAAGIAMATLTAISGALDQRCVVKMRNTGDWLESPRLWVCLIGESSTRKTPTLNGALWPLRDIETRFAQQQARDVAAWEEAGSEKSGKPPPSTRFILNDLTVEVAAEILARQDRGALVMHDELSSFIGSLDRYHNSSSADRGFWLQAWSGGPYSVDRMTRSRRINSLRVSFLAGMQPSRLRELEGLMTDGLMQRFLPVTIRRGVLSGEAPSDLARMRYGDHMAEYVGLKPNTYQMTGAALACAEEARGRLQELEDESDFDASLCAWIGKLSGYIGSLALLLHIIENRSQSPFLQISLVTVEHACRIVFDFLIPHGRAFYLDTLHNRRGEVEATASYILTADRDRFTPSDFRWNVSALKAATTDFELRGFLAPFVANGWLVEDGQKAWNLVPDLRQRFAMRRETELQRKAKIQKRFNAKPEEV
jgi:hypothetical protein